VVWPVVGFRVVATFCQLLMNLVEIDVVLGVRFAKVKEFNGGAFGEVITHVAMEDFELREFRRVL
jgi:hypothetical protein